MKVVTLSIVCKEGDAENIRDEMNNSNVAQLGLYTYGAKVREAESWEENEAEIMTPPDIYDKYMEK